MSALFINIVLAKKKEIIFLLLFLLLFLLFLVCPVRAILAVEEEQRVSSFYSLNYEFCV